MWNIDYNIHDLLKIKVRGNTRFDLGRNLKYSFFESSAELKYPDIILNIGKFQPSNENCDFISHKYYVKENYIYCKDKGRNAKWEVEINGFEDGQTTINFNGKGSGIKGILFPSFLAQEFLVPIIEYKLAQVNHFLIHGGAVSKDSNSYAFVGRPSAYKTTLIMDLIRRENYSLLSDDRIILSKNSILPFPISCFLFNFMINHMDTEKRTKKHDVILLKELLLKQFEEGPSMSRCSTLKSLIFISRADTDEIEKIDISLCEALEKLIINNRSEYVSFNSSQPSGSFYKYMLVYSLIHPDNKIAKYWGELYGNLNKILTDVPIYEVKMPYKYSPPIIDCILNMIDDLAARKG